VTEGEEKLSADEKVRRSVGRTLGNALGILVVLAVAAVWASFGVYQLEPGQAAVLLRFGRHVGTVTQAGLHWTLPPPLVLRDVLSVTELHNEDFGFRGREDEETPRNQLLEATMQTSDNNIVRVGFAVQFVIKDAFAARYRVAEPGAVIRDAAQAAMREVVGRETVDGVLRERRAAVTAEVATLLQETLDSYDSGILIDKVQLQDVQPPAAVRSAFDDVVSATQDANRLINQAEGYSNELIPGARAEAAELVEAAKGYREAKIAQATGDSERFKAVVAEYRKAPEVTQKRLYLETMELVLPEVQTVIIERGSAQVLPYLPLGRSDGGRQP
jgi:membrane protease subunit HflK